MNLESIKVIPSDLKILGLSVAISGIIGLVAGVPLWFVLDLAGQDNTTLCICSVCFILLSFICILFAKVHIIKKVHT